MKNKIINVVLKIFNYITWGIFGVILLLTIWIAFDKYILRNPVQSLFGYSALTIETGSMNGTSVMVEGGDPVKVSIGDLIIIKNTNDYKIGDVVTYIKSGETVPTTHRIIGYTADGYITKGDANNASDTKEVLQDEIIGEVVGHYPKFGKFISWIKHEGWIYFIGCFAVIIIGTFLIKYTNNEQEDEE